MKIWGNKSMLYKIAIAFIPIIVLLIIGAIVICLNFNHIRYMGYLPLAMSLGAVALAIIGVVLACISSIYDSKIEKKNQEDNK